MEIETLLDLIELILTQKDSAEAFAGAISREKFCFPYFDYLLSEGFLPNDEAILVATKMRQIEIVRFVLEKGVRPTLEAFQYAAEHEFFELCRLFVKFGSREILSTPELEEQLARLVMHDQPEAVINLINQGVNGTANNSRPLQRASQRGHLEVVRLLLEHGADPKTERNQAIRWASQKGHLEVARLLIEKGANPTDVNSQAIQYASHGGHLEVVRLLLEKGGKPTDHAVRYASGHDKLKIIELLEEYKAKL
jgi:ankyrin repeat protein